MRPCLLLLASILAPIGCGADSPDPSGSGTGSTSAPGSSSTDGGATTGGAGSSGSEADETSGGGSTGESGVDDTTGGPVAPPACGGDRLTGDVMRAEEVYLAGTLEEGACYLDVLAHWSTPDSAISGFDCDGGSAESSIRPTDGRLVYAVSTGDAPELRELHCDTCPIESVADYPAAPLRNDTLLPTQACDPKNPPTLSLRMSPTGDHVYQCFGTTWYDSVGRVVYDGELGALWHLGWDDLALTQTHVLDLSTGDAAAIAGLPYGTPLAIRADARGGFILAMRRKGEPEMWRVDSGGTATQIGTFSPPPDGYVTNQIVSALDGCGVLYQIGMDLATFDDVILRRELGGATEVVYSESTDPLVRIHISRLVSGP